MNNSLFYYIKKEKKLLIICTIFGIIYNVLMVYWPILQGNLLNSLINKSSFNLLINNILLYLIVILFVQISRIVKRYTVRDFANKTMLAMRNELYISLLRHDIQRLEEENYGDLMNKAINDVDITVEGMRKIITEIFDTGILMIAYFFTMLYIDVKITLLTLGFVPVAIITAHYLKTYIVKNNRKYRLAISDLSDYTFKEVDNNILYRLNSVVGVNESKYISKLNNIKKLAIKVNIFENSLISFYTAISLFGMFAVIYLGGQYVINGKFSIGLFTAYIIYTQKFAEKAGSTSKLFNSYQKAKISWNRIKDYFIIDNSKINATKNVSVSTLTVNNLSFKYKDKYIINNLSFTAKKGELVGITGPIACGKSTLLRALSGLYLYEGSIKIDNQELKDINNKYKYISYMPQNLSILNVSLKENICLSTFCRSVEEYLVDVGLDEDLKDLNKDENYIIENNGNNLSGGQKSRINLARALYANNDILILDDPLSALDINTANYIMKILKEKYYNKIIVMVCLDSTRFKEFDKMIYLNKNGEDYE